MTLKQSELIDDRKLCKEAAEILILIRNILKEAIVNNYEVCIVRE